MFLTIFIFLLTCYSRAPKSYLFFSMKFTNISPHISTTEIKYLMLPAPKSLPYALFQRIPSKGIFLTYSIINDFCLLLNFVDFVPDFFGPILCLQDSPMLLCIAMLYFLKVCFQVSIPYFIYPSHGDGHMVCFQVETITYEFL